MFESLKYIQKKFPYFLDMTADSNVTKVTQLLDDSFIDILNSLERVEDGYYFLNNRLTSLELVDVPVMVNHMNTVVFRTSELASGDVISFDSELFGSLGEDKLVEGGGNGCFNEHISIITETSDDLKTHEVFILAKDIKTVTITNLASNEETVKEFSYEEHQETYTTIIPPSDYAYKVTVETWEEYTYISYTDDYNTDLDEISATLSGATRRNYGNGLISLELVDVPVMVNHMNTVVFQSDELATGSVISFNSTLFGDLGEDKLVKDNNLDEISTTLLRATRRNYYVVNTLAGDDNNDGLTITTPYKTLAKAMKTGNSIIRFIGSEESVNYTITNEIMIIGDAEQSELHDVHFWIEPMAKLTLKNLKFNDVFITEKIVENTSDKTILI